MTIWGSLISYHIISCSIRTTDSVSSVSSVFSLFTCVFLLLAVAGRYLFIAFVIIIVVVFAFSYELLWDETSYIKNNTIPTIFCILGGSRGEENKGRLDRWIHSKQASKLTRFIHLLLP